MLNKKTILSSFIILICFGCDKQEFKQKASNAETLFTLIPDSQSNIDFKNFVKQDDNFNCVKYTYALIGGGVSVGDINNDGLDDIYFTANQTSNKLYLNKGNFIFEDITTKAKVEDIEGWTTGTNMIDINNDGWLDIYVCKSASMDNKKLRKNKLYINQKNGTFKEEAKSWGLDHDGFSIQSYFLDYDKDGDLDMYLVNHRTDFNNTLRIERKEKTKFFPETSDHLFRNDGDHFTDVTIPSKIINKQWGLSASIGDYNNDSWPDIYVANDYIGPDFLYINKKNGTFSNQIQKRFKHISFNSMGSDYADINNDFLPDLVVLEMSAEDHVRSKENMPSMNTKGFEKIVNSNYHYPYMANVLQLNNGNGSFSDIGQLAGISKTDWSWAPLLADFDNDGFKDLFVSNGVERNFSNQDYAKQVKKNLDDSVHMTIMEVIDMMPSDKLANYSYRNNGNLTFEKTSKDWGFDKKINSNGVAYSDLDNDGDLDLIMNNMSDKATLYKNNSTGNYINVKLIGSQKNPTAIGAKVKVYSLNKEQYQELYMARGYLSSVTNVLNFGLGNESKVNKIEVVWDNGSVSTVNSIIANQTVTIDIKNAETNLPTKKEVNRNLIPVQPEKLGISYTHKENVFNDFSKQVLLPHKLSQQGPTLSVADVNNDGLEDFFVGGAMNQTGELYIQTQQGTFEKTNQKPFITDKEHEDNGSLFFDADGDNDLDLYVASGGYEFSEKNLLLQDRLYINDGKGNYSKSNKLPKIINSTKSIGYVDYDNDGDNDLVIGGHIIPGKYPQAPNSYILQNNQGTFKDVTQEVAPEFSEIGIINDLILSDYDNDNDMDLLVVGEWMPITVFKNDNGNFTKTKIPALDNTEGWWNTIAASDIDNDGDQDYLFGNLGNNNKFHPSIEKPLHIYGNNFDDNETYDMVLSKIYKGNLVPVRGKECSTQQNAFISNKTPTYKEFALSTLTDIYGDAAINASYHKEAYQFGSLYAKNNGDGTFELKKLPSIAQVGPTMGFEFIDINNDGYQDVIGVGAIHEAEVETIRYDSNIGYILLGNAEGNFEPYKDLNFYNGNNAKGIDKITLLGKTHLIIANNDNELTIFKQ